MNGLEFYELHRAAAKRLERFSRSTLAWVLSQEVLVRVWFSDGQDAERIAVAEEALSQRCMEHEKACRLVASTERLARKTEAMIAALEARPWPPRRRRRRRRRPAL